jgi:maleate isomerase
LDKSSPHQTLRWKPKSRDFQVARNHLTRTFYVSLEQDAHEKSNQKEELEAMDAMSLKCAQELSDAHVDVMGYACLVAIMSMGRGYHCVSEVNLHQETVSMTSLPYCDQCRSAHQRAQGIGREKSFELLPRTSPAYRYGRGLYSASRFEVVDSIALEIPDNLEVAAQDPMNLLGIYKRLDLTGVDVLVASACVQMPSLEAIDLIEGNRDSVTSAAVAPLTK